MPNFDAHNHLSQVAALLNPNITRPATTSPPTKNFLFTLPAELRNKIYFYALSSPFGIGYVLELPSIPLNPTPRLVPSEYLSTSAAWLPPHAYGPLGTHAHLEANQLKYVCRQMRHETLRLELVANDTLTFRHTGLTPGYVHFLSFYENLAPALRQRVARVVSLEHSHPLISTRCYSLRTHWQVWAATLEGQGAAAPLYAPLQQTPQLHVVLRYDDFRSLSHSLWLELTTVLQLRLRGHVGVDSIEEEESVQYWSRVKGGPLRVVYPPIEGLENFRVSLTWKFDEEWIRQGKKRHGAGWKVGEEERIELAKKMFEEGV